MWSHSGFMNISVIPRPVFCSMVTYRWIARLFLHSIEARAAGLRSHRIKVAQCIAFTAHFNGVAVYLLIGLLNPHGLGIVLTSALAASMGGTSGLLWMMRLPEKTRDVPGPGLHFARSWVWIIVAARVTATYAAVLGPTV